MYIENSNNLNVNRISKKAISLKSKIFVLSRTLHRFSYKLFAGRLSLLLVAHVLKPFHYIIFVYGSDVLVLCY